MLKTTELYKRKRSQGSTDTELSPSSVQLSKKLATPNSIMNSVGHPNVPLTPTRHLTPSPTHYQVPYPQMALPGSYPMVSPGAGTGPQQAFISDLDIQRIAEAVRGIVVNDVQTLITPLKDQISTLQKENLELRREIDELEMYSRRNCVRVAGVSEDRTDTDDVILDIASKLDIPIKREEITVSHRVGPKNNDRPRQIIARITNYELRHRLLKSSKQLRKIAGMENIAVNQDLTKTRIKLAYEARKLVKAGRAKSSFVWDGKIFVIDHGDKKHKILCPADMVKVLTHLGVQLETFGYSTDMDT